MQMLERVSVVWSFEHADILFFQGLLDWVALFMIPFLFEHVPFNDSTVMTDLSCFTPKWLMQVETDTYFTLCCILDKYYSLYSADFERIFNAVEVLQDIMQRNHPSLNTFLLQYPNLYLTTSRSFICPFTRNFVFPQLFTVFDALLSTDIFVGHFYFVAALFTENESHLMVCGI